MCLSSLACGRDGGRSEPGWEGSPDQSKGNHAGQAEPLRTAQVGLLLKETSRGTGAPRLPTGAWVGGESLFFPLFSKTPPLTSQSKGPLSDHLDAPSFPYLSICPLEAHSSCESEGVAF